MSSSRQFSSDNSRRAGKAPERSNFVQTCNLLSQYLKEKGSLRDLSLGISGKLEPPPTAKPEIAKVSTTTTTMNLLTNMEKSSDPSSSTQKVKFIDSLPQYVTVDSSSISEHVTNKSSSSKEAAAIKTSSAQMTMFYAGEVLVFDGLAEDKAREIMLLASKGSSHNTSALPSSSKDRVVSLGGAVASSSSPPEKVASTSAGDSLPPRPDASGSDLPIARRSSLHRFLEKRKDRANARAPYQVNNPQPSSSKNDEQLELKL